MKIDFCIGDWTVRPQRDCIECGSKVVHIAPKAMAVLQCLAHASGEAVSRQELFDSVWPGGEISDDALTQQIVELRKAFGDAAQHSRVIETIPKIGFRLIPSVTPFADKAARSLKTSLRLSFVFVVAVVAVLATYWHLASFRGTQEPVVADTIPSVAVLPFVNMSSDPEQEYFVAGMHDALISELALISSLTVISRTSMLRYEKTTLTIPEIARELNVSMIVEGSVFKSGDQVRIQVQLIGSYPERHLLAQTYDRNLSQVLELQAEVTQDIAEKIKLTLTPQEQTRLADARIVDPETYTLWLKGNFHLTKSDEESFRKALTLYQEAAQRDPEYAPAYAGQARAYMALGGWHGSVSPRDVIQLAKKAAERALRLDPSDAEAHLALGGIRYRLDWDWAGADRAFRQGITLKPNDTLGRIGYANFLTAMGRFKESVEIGRRTLELEPLLPAAYGELAFPLVLLKGHDDEALELIREGLEIDPSFQVNHMVSILLYQMRGDFEEALAQLTHMERIRQTWSPSTMGAVGQAYAFAGRDVEARALLSHLLERRAMEYVSACALVYIYLGLGEDDEALRWLEVAYDEHDVSLVWLKEMWMYDHLRSDQRFQSILDRMDFPEP